MSFNAADSAVIRANGVGKRYQISHKQRPDQRSLRDAVTAGVSRLLNPWRSRRDPATAAKEDFWALRDVTFEVARGEVVGIIGHNGAGKSTLLKILSRITEPTEGAVQLRGRVASLLEVGTGFHPELTGRENVFLNGAILGMKRTEIRRKFDEIVAFAEVERFLDTPVKHYSSGMYVRLAFSVAAHLDPEILIVDEVLAVGDVGFQRKCLGKMQEVSRDKARTVLFVSHNMPAVARLCDRTVLLRSGLPPVIGPTADILARYTTEGVIYRADRSWTHPGDAPGDDRVRLLAARVLQDGVATHRPDIDRDIVIEMTFETLQPVRNLITGVGIHDASDMCLTHSSDWQPNELAKGRYSRSVTIPAQTLATGPTRIALQLVFYDVDANVQSVYLQGALSFDASESGGGHGVRGRYLGPWPGVMRLSLPWTGFQRQAG